MPDHTLSVHPREIADRKKEKHHGHHPDPAPGEIAIERLSAQPSPTALEHQASPAGLLRLTRRAYGAEPMAWLIGMGGSDFEMGDNLSPAALVAVDKVIEEINRCTSPGLSKS